MSNIIEEIGKEIIKFIICIIVARFLFLTGEIVLSIFSLGFHKPIWKGYYGKNSFKLVFKNIAVAVVGFCFWIAIFPASRFLLAQFQNGI